MLADDPVLPLIVLRHADWEGPHRVADALADIPQQVVDALAGDRLPEIDTVAGVVAMGGPMNVDDTGRHPGLARERAWLERAVEAEVPVLGVCLGSQLLARTLGAAVRPGDRPEIGFAPVTVANADDPVLGRLAPRSVVLHWHGDVFDLPPGAERLAWSAQTECQAFRYANCWAVLFHPEADGLLVERWLSIPEMAREARAALGAGFEGALREAAERHEQELVERSTPGFKAFGRLVLRRRERLLAEAR